MFRNFHLTLLMGPTLAVAVPRELTDALQSVQVTTSSGGASGFQLTFAVSKDSIINRLLLPVGFFDPNIRVILIVTLNGQRTVLMDGLITRQDLTPSNEPGQSTLTITGEDLSVAMDQDYVQDCYPALTAEAQVALICRRYALYGIVPLPIPTVLHEVPNPINRIQVQSGTDLAHIQALANVAGYVFYIDPGPLPGTSIAYWGPEVRVGIPQPALSVNLDAATNVESLSFSYDGRSKVRYRVMIQEPNTKFSITVPIPDVSRLRPPLALRPVAAQRTAPLPDTSHLSPIAAALRGLSETARGSDAITGQGTLDVLRYGHILKARGLVAVRGAGLTYDGFYYVSSVTHTIKRGEYKQSFQLVRDAVVSLTLRVMTSEIAVPRPGEVLDAVVPATPRVTL